MNSFTIYRIDSTVSGECLYVGATKLTIEQRLRQHLGGTKIGKMLAVEPHSITEIEVVSDLLAAREAETRAIAELGPKLNLQKTSHYQHNGGRPLGSKNSRYRPTRKAVSVRLSDQEIERLRKINESLGDAIRELIARI